MNKSEQINELAAAMAKAQAEIENASKNSKNPHFRSNYADLAEVLNTVRPVFSRHGLSVTQFPSFETGIVSVETVVMHSSGQWISGTISAPVSKQDAQGVGSATTYCRRYSLAAVAGVAQEDDDANSAVGNPSDHVPAKYKRPSEVATAPTDPHAERMYLAIKKHIEDGNHEEAYSVYSSLSEEEKQPVWRYLKTKDKDFIREAASKFGPKPAAA